MYTNHNRIRVSDLETNDPNKILITNEKGELTFNSASELGLGANKFRKENFEFTGSKIFTLSEPALNVLAVVVDGITLNGTPGAPLQYRMNTSTSLEILDEMIVGEDFWVSITYNYAGSVDGGQPGTGNYTADQITETANRKFQSADQQAFNDATSSIQAQLNSKEPSLAAGTNSQYFRGDKTWQTLDKSAVGLRNVNDTADTTKNVLSATKLTTARAINGVSFDGSANITINATDSTARIASSEKGAANGVATLDASGIIPTSQLPSYVDDVLEFTNLTSFPATGETGKIYIAKDTNKTYRWGASSYIYITSGAVDSVAGKTGVVTLAKADVGLANVDNTTDAAKNVLSATKLTTARTINGVSFDGSANITITDTSKENSITAGATTHYWRGDKTWQNLNTANVPESTNLYFSNARSIASTLTGYSSASGTISATDTILSAINKLNGNDDLKAPLASPIFTGSVTAPTFVGTLTGNASSASKLATARTINGVSFDGSANITINAADSTTRIASSEKGIANGVATLDASGIIPTSQLPSYVDDVLEFTNLASFPATGESGKIYIAKDSNKTYRWGGSSYIYITSGAVDSVAGKTGVVALAKADVGLASVDNTADTAKNVLSATKLTTARTINGVSFDGSTNITITDSTKESSITAGTTSQYWRGDKTWQPLTTANVPESSNLYFSNARSIASVLTGYSSTTGTILATDSILTAINKLNGNDALKAPLASPTFTGTVTAPTFSGALTGNASTATSLQTARTINGVSFNGSANITIADSTKLPLAGGTMSGDIIFPGTDRSEGIFGTYDSTKTQSIWSIGTAYRSSVDGSNFGTLYGLAYKHTNNTTGGTMASGHQMVWCSNGSPKSAIGDGIWTSGTITGDGSGLTGISQTFSIGGNAATATRLQTPRTINGVSFDGSANITIADSSKAPLVSPTFTGTVTAPTFVGNLNGNSTGFPYQGGFQIDNLPGSFSTIVREETPSSGYSYTSTLHMASSDGRQQLTISRDGSGMKFRGNTTASGNTGWTSWKTVLTDSNYSAYSAFSGAITGASLTVTGDVTAFSDARFKENIRPIENVIERIQASRGVVYDRIDNDQKDNVGFIAQELEENFPELVLTREDGTKAVKYQNAVAVLFEAIKKQQTQIEEQDKKLKLIFKHLNLNL
ncbi:tail fiber domain-containing protein [Flavobacterium sp. LPB0248]|uniref:tail fiber domain-containing protein n=1 Tax=Flavobacterium sp. LPB0248 TaxID=2614441 RepID=UPI0015A56354|nr:tail fiber domain-containing protein [Flavobacterium sp. LPB0248]QLC65779.1 tail fiber domain-containing protein [Flavobacterium sp. LPB0248]